VAYTWPGGGAPTALRVVFGTRLRTLREVAGLSYAYAACALDVTKATVHRMEKAEVGRQLPYVGSALSKVRPRITPFANGPHSARYGHFHIFRAKAREPRDVAYTESRVGAAYTDDRDDASGFQAALDRMCAQAAPAQSTEAILGGIHRET
jgi:DNA-binding XRE family transcriptional regulator